MPPAIASSYDASCVFSPSMLRSQGRIGFLREFPSDAPGKKDYNLEHRGKRHDVPLRAGDEYTPIWECKSTSPGVIHFPATSNTLTSPPPLAFAAANRFGGMYPTATINPLSSSTSPYTISVPLRAPVHILAFLSRVGGVPGTQRSLPSRRRIAVLNDGGGPAGVWMFAHFDRTVTRSAIAMVEADEGSPREKYTVWASRAQKMSPRNRLNAFRMGFGREALLDSTNEGDLDMMV